MKIDLNNKKELQEKIARLKNLEKRSSGYNKKLIIDRIKTYECFLNDVSKKPTIKKTLSGYYLNFKNNVYEDLTFRQLKSVLLLHRFTK